MRYADVDLTPLDVAMDQAGFEAPIQDAERDDMRDMVRAASRLLVQATGRVFVPYRATKTFDASGDHIDGAALYLREDLLAVTTLTNGDGSTIASSAYTLRPSNLYPKSRLELLLSGGVGWAFTTDYQDAIAIDGIWGFHDDWLNAWVDTQDTVPAGGITAAATAITVADADGRDAQYRTRFQTGGLLRIEDEYLIIHAIDTDTNTLTVARGQRGTTAAIHAEDTAIERYAIMRDVEQAATALAVWLYRNRETVGDKLQFLDGNIILSNEVPRHIQQVVAAYRGGL